MTYNAIILRRSGRLMPRSYLMEELPRIVKMAAELAKNAGEVGNGGIGGIVRRISASSGVTSSTCHWHNTQLWLLHAVTCRCVCRRPPESWVTITPRACCSSRIDCYMLLLAVTCATLQNTSFKLGDKHLSGMLLISPECYAHAHKTDLEDEAYTVSSIGGGGHEDPGRPRGLWLLHDEAGRGTRGRAWDLVLIYNHLPHIVVGRYLYTCATAWLSGWCWHLLVTLAGFPQPGRLPGCGPRQRSLRPEAPGHDVHL